MLDTLFTLVGRVQLGICLAALVSLAYLQCDLPREFPVILIPVALVIATKANESFTKLFYTVQGLISLGLIVWAAVAVLNS